MWINVVVKWAISHPRRSLIFEAYDQSHTHVVNLFAYDPCSNFSNNCQIFTFCQLKWQTFTLGNLILQKWHEIKIIGGIEMKSAIPFQFRSIPSSNSNSNSMACNSNYNSGIGIGIVINSNYDQFQLQFRNSRVTPLRRARSVTQEPLECCFHEFLIKMAKWPWRSS